MPSPTPSPIRSTRRILRAKEGKKPLSRETKTAQNQKAKRVKENYLALREQLEYDRESRLVVAVEDVTRAVGEEYAKVRTRLLAIPSENAPRIHRLKTVLEVQDAMYGLIVEALEELTRDGEGINR